MTKYKVFNGISYNEKTSEEINELLTY